MSFPHNQTVILKGLRSNVSDEEVRRFVADATPCVQRVWVMDDLYPVNKGYARYAYANYGDSHQAKDAKIKIDEAIRIAKAKADPIDPAYLTCFVRSVGPSLQPSFSLWIGDIGDDESALIEDRMSQFGTLTSMSVHGLQPVVVLEKTPGLKSAIVNYSRFAGAKAALDAVEAGTVLFGKTTQKPGLARRRQNTRLVFDLLDRCRMTGTTCLAFTEAQQTADSLGQDKPVAWVDVLRCCPEVFPVVDERSGFISVEEAWVHATAPSTIAAMPARGSAASPDRPPSPPPPQRQSPRELSGEAESQQAAQQAAAAAAAACGLEALRRMAALSLAPTPPRAHTPEPTKAAAAAPPPPREPREPREWTVDEVCGLLGGTCGFAAAAAGARENGVDGKTLVDLLEDPEGRALAMLKVEEGGLGLTPLQLRRVTAEVRLRRDAAAAAAD